MDTFKILEKAQEIFFKGMIQGYAGSNTLSKKTIPLLPGSKVVPTFEEGGFTLIDYYFTYPNSTKSFGTTLISCTDGILVRPVWIMHYGGWYSKEAIPFLKEILRVAYSKNFFSGGRGISPSQSSSFLYMNKIEKNEFSDFKGVEEIYNGKGTFLGSHQYFGGSLISE